MSAVASIPIPHLDGGELDPVEERYRIYERDVTEAGGIRLVATCSDPASVGVAIAQLAEDRWDAGVRRAPVLGVLDGESRRWLCGVWPEKP